MHEHTMVCRLNQCTTEGAGPLLRVWLPGPDSGCQVWQQTPPDVSSHN